MKRRIKERGREGDKRRMSKTEGERAVKRLTNRERKRDRERERKRE